jgi:uncharacterized protein YegP (UPF0339 family)
MSGKITRVGSDAAVEDDLTDWRRLESLTDDEIETAVAMDPDSSLGDEGDVAVVRGLVFRDVKGGWRWRLVGPDGAAIADSPRSYSERSEVELAIRNLRQAILAGETRAA